MIFSPQAPDPARPGQCGHRFSQRASSSAALVTQTRQSGEWYIQFNTLAALLIARQLPTYKTNEAKITNQFGIDSAPATMTHRLFLGLSNQFSRLSQKTNQSVSGPNDQFWIFRHFLRHFPWILLSQFAWWLQPPPEPRSCLRDWRSRSRTPSSTRSPGFVSPSHSDIESEPDSQRRWFLAALVRTIPSIPRLRRPVSPATDSPEVLVHVVMVDKSASKSLVVPRLLCGPWVRVSVFPHLRRGWTGRTEQVGTRPRILMIMKIPHNYLERNTFREAVKNYLADFFR